jgi:hypothetical protein
MAEPFCTFGNVAFIGGLKISGNFVISSIFDPSALSVFVSTSLTESNFGTAADSSVLYVDGTVSFDLAAEEALSQNSGITAGLI